MQYPIEDARPQVPRKTPPAVANKARTLSRAAIKCPVICALEGVAEEGEIIDHMRDTLHVWKGPNQQVLPVTVLSALDLAWPLRLDKKTKKVFLDRAAQRMQALLEKEGLTSEKAQFIESESLSVRKMAESLARFAQKQKAEILMVGSGAGERRQWTGLGSFSETLIALSKVPVMVFGSNCVAPSKISKIFFPTDLSAGSKAIFRSVLKTAQMFGAEVVLFHHFDLQMGPLMLGPYGVGVDTSWIDRYWQSQKEVSEQIGHLWERTARKAGVQCTYVPDYEFGTVSERMLAVAQKAKADLIVMGLKRGPVSQIIFGRVAREILAEASRPVLVYHQGQTKK